MLPGLETGDYWLVRFLFQRGLGLIYLIAFLVTANQFRPLVGENGLLPFTRYVKQVDFRDAPSLFHYVSSDRAVMVSAWIGVLLSLLVISGIPEAFGTLVSMLVWFLLWVLYLSIVNVGQTFYGYGWESMLLETGFLAIFLGGFETATPFLIMLLLRWVLFRNMFGAGLIKLRGDECWRDLTCMEYHYETQPMPNPFSWYADKFPHWFNRASVLGNHFVELVVPFFYFAPQPFAAVAGILTIGHMGWLMLTGNFAFLNALTIVLAISTFSDSFLGFLPDAPATAAIPVWHQALVGGVTLLVIVLSYYPVKNMVSSRQIMNTSFDPLHIVNTYGAFGSITKDRYEIVVQGTQDEEINEDTEWKTYEFKGKPTDPSRRPPQWAPYHLRLDWQMWFAAMKPRPTFRDQWFPRFLKKLLENDEDTLTLIRKNPFPDEPPEQVRAVRYRYEFTDREERKKTGDWWKREAVGTYYGPATLDE